MVPIPPKCLLFSLKKSLLKQQQQQQNQNKPYLKYFMVVFRISHRRCPIKNGVLKNFAKLTGKHLSRSVFFNKVAGQGHTYLNKPSAFSSRFFKYVRSRPTTLSKKRLQHRCAPVNFAKITRIPFYKTTPVDCFCMFDDSLTS